MSGSATSTAVTTPSSPSLMVLIGFAILVARCAGGGAARDRHPVGVLFVAAGAGRLWVARRTLSEDATAASSCSGAALGSPMLFSDRLHVLASAIYFALGVVAELRARA